MEWFDPINLWTAPVNLDLVPDADCAHCKYRGPYRYEDQEGHCYMFETRPGDKCGQFRREN